MIEEVIHRQQVYLTNKLLVKLYVHKGVKSTRIYQQVGQAVYVPDGLLQWKLDAGEVNLEKQVLIFSLHPWHPYMHCGVPT